MVWSFLYTFRSDRTVEDELTILDVWLDDNYWILVFQKINIGQLCFSMVHQHLRILRSDLIVQKWLLAFIGSKCTRPNYYLHLLFFWWMWPWHHFLCAICVSTISGETPQPSCDSSLLQLGTASPCLSLIHIPKTGGAAMEITRSLAAGIPTLYTSQCHAAVEKHRAKMTIANVTAAGDMLGRMWGACDDQLKCSFPVGNSSQCLLSHVSVENSPSTMDTTGGTACSKWHIPPGLDATVAASLTSCDPFCVVRSPMERLISEFTWQRYKHGCCDPACFEEFVASKLTSPLGIDDCHFVPQVFYVFEQGDHKNGKQICKHILQYHQINDIFPALMTRYGLDTLHLNKRIHAHQDRKICDLTPTAATLEMVRNFYAADYEAFGFWTFEHSRIKHVWLEKNGSRPALSLVFKGRQVLFSSNVISDWKSFFRKSGISVAIHLNPSQSVGRVFPSACEGEDYPQQKLRCASPPTAGGTQGLLLEFSFLAGNQIHNWWMELSKRLRIDFLLQQFAGWWNRFPSRISRFFWGRSWALMDLLGWGDGHCNTWFLNSLPKKCSKPDMVPALKKMEIPLDFRFHCDFLGEGIVMFLQDFAIPHFSIF